MQEYQAKALNDPNLISLELHTLKTQQLYFVKTLNTFLLRKVTA